MQVGGPKHLHQPIVVLSSLVDLLQAWLVIFVKIFMYELVDGLTDDPMLDSNVLALWKIMADGGQIYAI